MCVYACVHACVHVCIQSDRFENNLFIHYYRCVEWWCFHYSYVIVIGTQQCYWAAFLQATQQLPAWKFQSELSSYGAGPPVDYGTVKRYRFIHVGQEAIHTSWIKVMRCTIFSLIYSFLFASVIDRALTSSVKHSSSMFRSITEWRWGWRLPHICGVLYAACRDVYVSIQRHALWLQYK